MNKLSKEAENKLLVAIEKTAALVNSGLDPNSAIAKAASEDGIPPGHINLMVHAYNTGRTSRQRMDGADAMEKAADFPLADAAAVLDQLYPAQVKTAAAIARSVIVSTEYGLPPTGVLERRARQEKLARAKDIDWSMGVSAPEEYPRDPMEAMKRAYAKAESLRRGAEEARRKTAAAFDKMADTFNDITTYFRRTDATPIPIVKEQAFLLHGDKGEQLIDQIVAVTPGLAKMARHKQAVNKNSLHSVDGEVYGLISQFLDELEDYRRLKQAQHDVEKSAATISEDTLRPFVHARRSVLDEMCSPDSEKRANGLMPWVYGASAVKNLIGGAADSAQVPGNPLAEEKMYQKLTDPDHEAQLRNIQSQAMLQDLLLNDPVISSYEPQQAIDAYNDIVQMSPRAGGQRVLMQSLLRKRLEQGAMDPFEVDQLLGMEEKQRKIATPPGKGVGDGTVLS